MHQPVRTLNINLYAGPGVGKSTAAAALFVALKRVGVTTEMVAEYAKELQYAGKLRGARQSNILRTQHRRQKLMQGHVQVAISDSPVPISLAYCTPQERAEFEPRVRRWLRGWDSVDVLVHRDLREGYEQAGRYQGPEEAIAFHRDVLAPFVAGYVGPSLISLHVDECVPALTQLVLERVRGAAATQNN